MSAAAKYVTVLCLICLALVSNKCKKREDMQMQLLQKTWLHSHEDDQGDIRTYRPNTYDFPPSRGRTGFTFEKDGTYKQYDIAPTDGLEEHTGRWEAKDDDKIKIMFNQKDQQPYEIEIISVEPNMLKIKREYPDGN